jgi:hypothetical protein
MTAIAQSTRQRTAVDTNMTLAIQTRQLAEHYPELYEYLKQRDRALERALARIPSRADVELASVFNARRYLEKTMKSLAPGVGDLNGLSAPESATDASSKEEEIIDG